jgi:hypothetical protein
MRLIDWWLIRPFFDAAFYLERYPDVRQAGMNPLRHYLRHGAAEGRKPHRLFEPEYYLSCCPEARKSRSPLLHFIETGGGLGNPHPLFDCSAYLAANRDAAKRGVNPLLHYISSPTARRRTTATGSYWENYAHDMPELIGPEAFGVHQTVSLEVFDVQAEIIILENALGRETIAEPQQQPFFRAMRFDQLSAQLKP